MDTDALPNAGTVDGDAGDDSSEFSHECERVPCVVPGYVWSHVPTVEAKHLDTGGVVTCNVAGMGRKWLFFFEKKNQQKYNFVMIVVGGLGIPEKI